MRIYGAGMAGLLAAHMLRRHKPVVCEKAESLPNNHSALLRFRTDAVSRATGIPFKKVRVQKMIYFQGMMTDRPNFYYNNLYSQKVTGEILGRSVMNMEPADRYIAPPDFIQQLASSVDIEYNSSLNYDVFNYEIAGPFAQEPIISTIPMSSLMELVHWKEVPQFNARPVTTITATICNPIDVYQTIYYPHPMEPVYRTSITGDKLILEMVGINEIQEECEDGIRQMCDVYASRFGIEAPMLTDITINTQKFGKITPINDSIRKEFILAMSDRYSIYSVGRFATWRQILLDDVVHDVEVVDKFISQRDGYAKRLAIA